MAQSDLDKMVFYARDDDAGLLQLDSPTTHFGPADSGDVAGVAIGFTFYVGGVAYTTCTVCTSGFVQFAGTVDHDNANLFAANSDVIIAPWYDQSQLTAFADLAGGAVSGYLKSETQGVAPFRRFVVEWYTNVYVALAGHLIRYQLVLYETKDAFEFRYAAAVLDADSAPTASRGIKVGTSYRDLYWPTGSGTMGGEPSTATTTLSISDYANYVPYVFVGEPNWPMCGRAFMVDPNMITGRDIFGSSDVIWRIANFANWLFCRHTPPLINIAPYEETDRATVTYVVPCVPSDEGLPYRVYVQVWATAGANCTVEIYEDAVADPQPTTPGSWSLIDSEVQAVTGAAWNELTDYVITIDPDTTYLRFVVSVDSGALRLGSVMLVPNQASDLDETYTSLTGFVPMSIGMIRNLKAPVHPEWFNRAWANIAHVLRDRRQMVWSSVWPEHSLISLASTTAKPIRVIGTSKCWLPVRGAECKARIYARDSLGSDAPLMLAEAGNGLIAEWGVDWNTNSYRAQHADVSLISDEPHITATCDPNGTLSPMAVVIDWAPTLSTASLFPGVTPAPRLASLFALIARMDFALRCNVATGLATLLARGKTSSNKWHVQTWVGPAVVALRAKVARDNTDQTASSGDTLIYAASSGSGANDEVYIETPHDRGRDDYPPEGRIEVVAAGEDYDAAPSATMSRLLESPTATDMTGGARERVEIVRGVGVVLSPVRFADPLAL